MKLIITRHGETLENKEGIVQGHIPGTLSELGKEQAKKLAERLKNEKIDYIYSSDLKRSSDTAKEIAKFHKNAKFKLVKDLRERFFAEFEGKKKTDLGLSKDDFIADALRSENTESDEKLYLRAKNFLDETLHHHKNQTVLFVGHNGINKALICAIMNKSSEYMAKIPNLRNTSINIYSIDENKNHEVILFNCIKHLD